MFFLVLAAKQTFPLSVQQGICPRTLLSVSSATQVPTPQSRRHTESLSLCSTASNHSWGMQYIILNIFHTDPFLLLLPLLVIFYSEFYNNLLNVPSTPFYLYHSHPLNVCNKYTRLTDQIMALPSSKFFHGPILSIKRREKNKLFSYHVRSHIHFLYISALQSQ